MDSSINFKYGFLLRSGEHNFLLCVQCEVRVIYQFFSIDLSHNDVKRGMSDDTRSLIGSLVLKSQSNFVQYQTFHL